MKKMLKDISIRKYFPYFVLVVIAAFFIFAILLDIFYHQHEGPYMRTPIWIIDHLEPIMRQGKLPQDLADLNVWHDRLTACQPTKRATPGHVLTIYNPNYDKNEQDWVVAVGYDFEPGYSSRRLLVLLNDCKCVAYPVSEESINRLFGGRTNLRYYYVEEESYQKLKEESAN